MAKGTERALDDEATRKVCNERHDKLFEFRNPIFRDRFMTCKTSLINLNCLDSALRLLESGSPEEPL